MTPEPESPADTCPPVRPLNEYQRRHLYSSLAEIEKLLNEIERIVAMAGSKSLFPRYVDDLTPSQRKLLEGGIARLRASVRSLLEAQGLRPAAPSIPASGAIRTTLVFAEIAAEELSPRTMRGYGDLDATQAREVEGVIAELRGRVGALLKELTPEPAEQLSSYIAQLPPSPLTQVLAALEHITRERGMLEFRAGIALAAARLAAPTMEVAVFGRVSCGKSSLLNFLLGADLLPTGPTPVTSVPTRIRFAEIPSVVAQFERSEEAFALHQLIDLASEERNPDNRLGITRLTVAFPSPKLRNGVVFVDTPGLGSIRNWGAMQTLAYLPRSDMAILLIDIGSALGADELELVRWLHQGGMPLQVLVSKADLATPAELAKSLQFTSDIVTREVGDTIGVHAVSTRSLDMAEAWFAGEIIPLYGALQERLQASHNRRIAKLRDNVLSALKTASGASPPSLDGAATTELARRLRGAEAEDEHAQDALHNLPSHLESEADSAIAAIAVDLAYAWRQSPPPTIAILQRIAAEALGRTMVAGSQAALDALDRIARTYKSTLAFAGTTLPGFDTQYGGDGFVPRDLPMPELGPLAWKIRPPRLPILGASHVTRQFRRQLQPFRPEIANTLRHYGSALQRSAFAEATSMRHQFQSRADVCRATLQRLGGTLPREAPITDELASSVALISHWRPSDAPLQPAPESEP